MNGVTKESLQRIAQFSNSKNVTLQMIGDEFKSLLDDLDDLPEDGKEEARQYMLEMLDELEESSGMEGFEEEEF